MAETALPRIVLFPALGLDAHMFDPLARALQGRADVVAIDYPSFGANPGDATSFELAPEGTLLARLAAWLAPRALEGGAPTIVGGVSLGATLTVMLKEVLRPRALLLVAGGGLNVPRARREAVTASMDASDAASFAADSLGFAAPSFEASRFREHFGSAIEDARAYYPHWRGRVWGGRGAPERAVAYGALLRAALDVDLEGVFSANDIPADIVWGEDDRVFSARFRRQYVAALRRGTLHLLAGVGHFVPLEAPEALAAIVLARLQEPARTEGETG